MRLVLRIVATVLLGMGQALVVVETASAVDQPAGCTYRHQTVAINNGHLIVSNSSYRAFADHRLQLRTAPGCDPGSDIRGVTDFRCQRYAGGWTAVACGSHGLVLLHEMFPGVPTLERRAAYNFATTGPDGITTVYGAWLDYRPCPYTYRSTVQVDQIKVGTINQSNRGRVGSSHVWPEC